MTASRNPNLIGQIALQEGYVAPQQLEECLAMPSSQPLGARLVAKGYLTQEKLDELIRIQAAVFSTITADPLRGGLFGQIAVRLGYVSDDRLNEALREQSSLGGTGSLRLGQILLKRSAITPEQFLDVLRRQRREVVKCPGCGTFYDAAEHPETDRFVCATCTTVVHTKLEASNSGNGEA